MASKSIFITLAIFQWIPYTIPFNLIIWGRTSHHCNQLRKENARTPATLRMDFTRSRRRILSDLRDREGKPGSLDPENEHFELFPRRNPSIRRVKLARMKVQNRNLDTGKSNLPVQRRTQPVETPLRWTHRQVGKTSA